MAPRQFVAGWHADSRLKAVILLNARCASDAQSAGGPRNLEEALHAAGLEAEVRVLPGSALAEAAREAVQAAPPAIVAAGGDGTVSAVAGALAGSETPLGVLPLGTLNHFARALRIPPQLDLALQIIAKGHTRAVDVGEVNGRVFVNNSSLGLYPRLVREREELCRRRGRGRWTNVVLAALEVVRRFPLVDVHVQVEGRDLRLSTPFVFVGNNAYSFRLLSLEEREALDQGVLELYLAAPRGRTAMLRLAIRALLGSLRQDRDFTSLLTREVRIDTRKDHLHVAADGELLRMAPPLVYRMRPRALRVIAPPVGSPPRKWNFDYDSKVARLP